MKLGRKKKKKKKKKKGKTKNIYMRFIFFCLLIIFLNVVLSDSDKNTHHKHRHTRPGLTIRKDKKHQIGYDPVNWDHPMILSHSFLQNRDATFWSFGGSTVLWDHYCRLTPKVANKNGWLWNNYALESNHFETSFDLSIKGKQRYGGDGLAFWLMDPAFDPNFIDLEGDIFGMRNDFQGVGLIIDTYDNNNDRKNPMIGVIVNHHSEDVHNQPHKIDPNDNNKDLGYNRKNFDIENDFENTLHKELPYIKETGPANLNNADYKCVLDLRNRDRKVNFLIKYLHNVLHVYVDLRNGKGYGQCLSVEIDENFIGHHILFTAQNKAVYDQVEISQIYTRYLSKDDKDDNDYNASFTHEPIHTFTNATIKICLCFILLSIIIIISYKIYIIKTKTIDEFLICKELNTYKQPMLILHSLLLIISLFYGYYWSFLSFLIISVWYIMRYDMNGKTFKYRPPLKIGRKGLSSMKWLMITDGLYLLHMILFILFII